MATVTQRASGAHQVQARSRAKVIQSPFIHLSIHSFTSNIFLKPCYVLGLAMVEPGNLAVDMTGQVSVHMGLRFWWENKD